MAINDKWVDKYYHIALYEAKVIIENEARKILKSDDSLSEFIMGMGTWFFTSTNDMRRIDNEDIAPELADFIDKWDDYLRLTGIPMRFTATGVVVTEW